MFTALPPVRWDTGKRRDEAGALAALERMADLDAAQRIRISERATGWVTRLRTQSTPGMMDAFLAEYGLSTEEGVALMCLAEALLRVPDAATVDALIEDKVAASDWSRHLGQASSPLVNASTWGLLLTGRVLDDVPPGIAGRLKKLVRRVGEPVIRSAVAAAMREMGRHFVLGQDIKAAMERAAQSEAQGLTYSYDMLGEAALTHSDARRYGQSYSTAIAAIAGACGSDDLTQNPGISVKLSALFPRYEVAQTQQACAALVTVLRDLARAAARANMGLNVDAEEADRLGLSLMVIEEVLADPDLAGWDGFGVVVQAYGRRAPDVIDGLYDLATRLDRRIMVRLVKGAYWDTEIKHAQVQGLTDMPVFTRKAATDVSYLGCARQLLGKIDRIYPQFATHNAHTVAAVLEMAKGLPAAAFEFQRLHGMGDSLHDLVRADHKTRCRIYAPVGAHRDLLAYLVRRLLENGANSSFVNQIVDTEVPAGVVAACPFAKLAEGPDPLEPTVRKGPELFAPERRNAMGWDLSDSVVLADIAAHRTWPATWEIAPLTVARARGQGAWSSLAPASGKHLGRVIPASPEDAVQAVRDAAPWDALPEQRASILRRAADAFEADAPRAFALLASEAGKTLADAVSELREAVDFLRYYAARAGDGPHSARGVFTCISPWNFPIAIFTGQISAALATGNAVLAKPAEATSACADWAVRHLHAAGVPLSALQLLPGSGGEVGHALVTSPRVDGVAFTGSTATARKLQAAMAENLRPGAPLIAETGGLNAMIVDSTALLEQAVRDVVASAFQSAGQRCSALRCLYVQEDIAPAFTEMLFGAMDALQIGDPWELSTDVGPVISRQARDGILDHVARARAQGRVLHECSAPEGGFFVAPVVIKVDGIADLQTEVFGPVLHLATFRSAALPRVIDAVNATGYGLTFGLHSRIDARVQMVANRVQAGNVYANRNQIGAVVGSQPFGGEGLSGTGPKAGGPTYLARFCHQPRPMVASCARAPAGTPSVLQTGVLPAPRHLPGPTGELNRLSWVARAPVLCLGPGVEAAAVQAALVTVLGGQAVQCVSDTPARHLAETKDCGGVMWWCDDTTARNLAIALARREGPIVPLITDAPDAGHVLHERHLCVDTTAAGGNTALLAGGG